MRRFLLLQAIAVSIFHISHGQADYAHIQTSWNQKKYREVIRLIDAYYATSKRKVLKLDLMKITSMCKLGITPPRTSDCFDYIIKAYKLSKAVEQKLYLAKEGCNSAITIDDERDITTTTELPRVAGKMGYTTDQFDYVRRGDTMKFIKHISTNALRQRIVPHSMTPNEAITKWKNAYGTAGISNINCRAAGKFLIAYSKLDFSDAAFTAISIKLQRYYHFYIREYGMDESRHYIHVFLAKDYNELNEVSTKLYGFSPPSYTLGYSSLDDQSIVAIAYVPDKPLMGTTCHELFHILCKNTFETLPPWLEEGMASLYEVSEPRGNTIIGLNNWRINFLKNFRHHDLRAVPLESIIRLNWSSFNAPDRRYEANQSFNYAYSRYLMLYLQNKGTLKYFFREAVQYNYTTIREGVVEDYTKMVTKYAKVQGSFKSTFSAWVNGLPSVAR